VKIVASLDKYTRYKPASGKGQGHKPHIYWNRRLGMWCCGLADYRGIFRKRCDPDRLVAWAKFEADLMALRERGMLWEVFP
jgi:hypothetical protein